MNQVHSVAFNSNGKLLASASTDETVRLWDITSLMCVKVLTDRPYEGLNIRNVRGLSETEVDTLKIFGAVEQP